MQSRQRSLRHDRPQVNNPAAKRFGVWGLVFLAALLLAACSDAFDRTPAEATAQAYFAALQAGDYAKAAEFYPSPVFFAPSKDDLIRGLRSRHEEMGGIVEYQMTKYGGVSQSPANTRYSVVFDVTYGKGTAQETVSLEKSRFSDDVRVTGHTWPVDS